MQRRGSAKACARPAEALAEGAEAAEDVDGMSKRGVMSSRSLTEENGLRQVLTARERGAIAMVAHGLVVGCASRGFGGDVHRLGE